MESKRHKERKIFAAAILAVLMIFSLVIFAELSAASQRVPPYRPSGAIPGTVLLYERLSINDRGEVQITIVNPTNNGVAFTANFSFFDNSERYLTGFTVDGFAAANRKIPYSLDVGDRRAYQRATMMRVLGRGGRMGREPDTGDGG